MTATVHALRPNQGPPETDFEREAVETLLSNLRRLREDSGLEPETVLFVTIGSSANALGQRVGWLNESSDSLRMRFAYGASLLSEKAVEP